MSWAKSLIKLSTYEVETLQKRLAEIADRRAKAEMRLTMLAAEGEAETILASSEGVAAMQMAAYMGGLRIRKEAAQREIDSLLIEERGARDALARAFEEQKKYEQVAETARKLEVKEESRRETAALDELGLRKAVAR